MWGMKGLWTRALESGCREGARAHASALYGCVISSPELNTVYGTVCEVRSSAIPLIQGLRQAALQMAARAEV